MTKIWFVQPAFGPGRVTRNLQQRRRATKFLNGSGGRTTLKRRGVTAAITAAARKTAAIRTRDHPALEVIARAPPSAMPPRAAKARDERAPPHASSRKAALG